MEDLLRPSNPVFAGYAFYSAILIIKMILMSFLTAAQRFRKKHMEQAPVAYGTLLWKTIIALKKKRISQAFVNVEDAIAAGVDIKLDDQDVERVRRAHLNDLENIPVFLISGLIFVATDPNPVFALMCFRLYAVARFMHTIVYAVVVVRQPARILCFCMGAIINFIILAHLNDLENIPVFLVSGLIFVATDPNPVFALMCFRLYAVARFMHTIVYVVVVVRQPARGICFNMGVIINFIILCAIISNCVEL